MGFHHHKLAQAVRVYLIPYQALRSHTQAVAVVVLIQVQAVQVVQVAVVQVRQPAQVAQDQLILAEVAEEHLDLRGYHIQEAQGDLES
jgi:hypothetical protein